MLKEIPKGAVTFMMLYEKHTYSEKDFPVIFHLDRREQDSDDFPVHWHENIELLYFVEGDAEITLNDQRVHAQKGDMVVINSEMLHWIRGGEAGSAYYCLISDRTLTDSFPFMSPDSLFTPVIRDRMIAQYFDQLAEEMNQMPAGYQRAVFALIELIFLQLTRRYQTGRENRELTDSGNPKVEMVKSAIRFLRGHYREGISVADVCTHVGFSKCYFCHVFKEITGQTALEYLNRLRCMNARKMMASGQYNISESALQSGFHNLSYFSRTYKKVFGRLPSQEKHPDFAEQL